MPVYFPSLRRVLIQPAQAQAEYAWLPGVPLRGGLPVQRRSPT